MKLLLILVLIIELTLFDIVNSCKPSGISNKVSIGKDTYVCVKIAPLDWTLSTRNGTYLRIAQTVKADNITSITIDESWTSESYHNDTLIKKLNVNQQYGDGVAISVESMGLMSYQKLYRSVRSQSLTNETVTYPVFMAIINVHLGEVKSVLWDDTCKWCHSNNCVDNTYDYYGNLVTDVNKSCYLLDTGCVHSGNSTTPTTANSLCELKVYVTWTGTDSRGHYFKSASSRFSRLQTEEMKYYTNHLKDKVSS